MSGFDDKERKAAKLVDGIAAVLEAGLIVDSGEDCIYWASFANKEYKTPYVVCNSHDNNLNYVEFEDMYKAIACFIGRALGEG